MTEPPPHPVTVVTCPGCHGSGHAATNDTADSPAQACGRCGGAGKRRAQLVLTAVNIDTGAIASANVLPGITAAAPTDDDPYWFLNLLPVICDLTRQVDAADLHDPRIAGQPIFAPEMRLARQWQPDLPVDQRYVLEAETIAAQAHDPWRIWYGRSTPELPADPAQRLAALGELAELLCLDLVVEVRRSPHDPDSGRFHWDVRFELPGSPVPTGVGSYDSFTDAATCVDVARACYALVDRSRHAPAHYVTPRPASHISLRPPPVDPDQLERRIVADCLAALLTDGPALGAQAIWRNGRWWHTTLHADTDTDTDSGSGGRLVRTWQPSPPTWQGPPIPYRRCPDCAHWPSWENCDCARINGCATCGGTHRIYHGATVTIAVGRRQVRHLNWPPPGGTSPTPPPCIGYHPSGRTIHQLPPEYQLTHQLTALGLDPTELTTLDGLTKFLRDHELLHGYATVQQPGGDPITAYLEDVTKGHPVGRILLHATPPKVPPLATVVKLAYGLGVALVVSVADHRRSDGIPYQVQGLRWGVRLAPPDTTSPLGRWYPGAYEVSLPKAIAQALEYVRHASNAILPTDPTTPIPAPTNLDASSGGAGGDTADPVPALTVLATHHPGTVVTAVLAPQRYDVHLSDGSHHTTLIATADTLTAAVTAAMATTPPDPNTSSEGMGRNT
ncbi:hypothetical protein O7621_08325 [Solwaraspora sp. WMMD937]|uniref:hypothetical protein n=1 Tax=Solwaraspora sp. WMMD937 TaxID=3016090 RepID=UPI00249B9123|nr:hypothetical protein [Solwaraspora sp. WMMD937]WFE23294.1 hypothetical protein O7621_08325 [Solwaraspora sp. WMMD937]